MTDDLSEAFAVDWFDRLNRHDPVDLMLPRLARDGLEMAFPERTLRGHDDFAEWYEAVGRAYTDQRHTLERFRSETRGPYVDLDLTVLWTATQTADGARDAYRIDQTWRLIKGPGEQLRILTYRVGALRPIPLAEADAVALAAGRA
ncbi:nuclear transport factor 2 family protein [Actinospica sp. MGRD01-02]|jgi:hypothetical protein|uniref:Nuclear transport factor 2 family protein n=1 Tax=Actinospica acidithermotolerans TaxID=2828514 RepID=A0A941EGV1_9ACTN|nr:nuclear transport factor 2 family protein [Actinospica acidithermotolerans]MBR7830513.1 nuclear transport factor 2 family protein [Actinospica acidithermotolerans]